MGTYPSSWLKPVICWLLLQATRCKCILGLEATSTFVVKIGKRTVSSHMQVDYATSYLLVLSQKKIPRTDGDRANKDYRVYRKILDVFLCNNPSLVNQVEVIPGISDHEAVYAESSLCPLKGELRHVKEDCHSIEQISTSRELRDEFRFTMSSLMKKFILSKMLKGNKIQKPWIDRKVKSVIKRRNKLFTRIRKTKNETNVGKYQECKKNLQKAKRHYGAYVSNIIESKWWAPP